ncbi:MAG: hypothetical protein DMG81_01330 [Acidobacteria bacterium]|nr:MAG: hypothetical protein DMG81_01330 [Acidobacteriota bacterium]
MALDNSAGAKKAFDKERPTTPATSAAHPDPPPGSSSALTEDAALALLKRPDLSCEEIERLGKHGSLLRSRKVKLAMLEHARTPRHISLPLVRQLYTFDLMQVALTPVVPADVKLAADDALCHRLETISSGERLTLAHRGSSRIAEALLADAEARVVHAALQNSRLTEARFSKRFRARIARRCWWKRFAITRNGRFFAR